jgi:hypothetical protein
MTYEEKLCEKLKTYVSLFYCSRKPPTHEGVYARETEDGLFTFGTKKPFTRNTVTKAFAIWIVLQKIETEPEIRRTK